MNNKVLKTSKLESLKTSDIINTLTSWVGKSCNFLVNFWKNLVSKEKEWNWFLQSLNKAWITPNNITTFRLFLVILWTILYFWWNGILALSILTTSCILDVTDWKLARKYWQWSKEWETFDAWLDKISDINLTILSTISLNEDKVLAIINWIVGLYKTNFHIKSQFREWRPSFEEQVSWWLNCIFKSENISFKKASSWAANDSWKFKTLFQFISWLWLLWTNELESIIDMWLADEVLEFVFVSMSWVSLALSQDSISNSKK